jgi:hypothetical protein
VTLADRGVVARDEILRPLPRRGDGRINTAAARATPLLILTDVASFPRHTILKRLTFL